MFQTRIKLTQFQRDTLVYILKKEIVKIKSQISELEELELRLVLSKQSSKNRVYRKSRV